MATINAKKHSFEFTVTGNESAKLDSMLGSGPLTIHKENWFAVVGKDLLPASTANKVPIQYYDVDGVMGGAWIFSPAMVQLEVTWIAKMIPLAQLLADLCEAGLSWEPAKTWKEMRLRVHDCMSKLTDERRELDVGEVIFVKPATSEWFDHVTPAFSDSILVFLVILVFHSLWYNDFRICYSPTSPSYPIFGSKIKYHRNQENTHF